MHQSDSRTLPPVLYQRVWRIRQLLAFLLLSIPSTFDLDTLVIRIVKVNTIVLVTSVPEKGKQASVGLASETISTPGPHSVPVYTSCNQHW